MGGAIVAVLTSVLVSAGVSAVGAAIIANVAVIGLGLGLSLLSQVLFRPAAPPQPKPSDGQSIVRQATARRFRAYGRVKVGGVLMFANTKGGTLHRVVAMGSGEIDAVEEHWIDDTQVTLSGEQVTTAKYLQDGNDMVQIAVRLGDDAPSVYGALQTAFPALWTANHLGKGIPSVHLRMGQPKQENLSDMFPALANTNYRQVQRGAKVRGISGGAFTAAAYSDNAALIIADYLTHADGLGLADSWISNAIDTWEAAAAVCGEAVALKAGGTEPRWRIWNTYYFDERPADVLARLMQACDAAIYPTPDRGLAIRVGEWEAPTVTIDDDAVIAFTEVGRGRDVLTTANTIRARYTSADHDYQETDAEPWVDAADVAARGEFAADIDLFAAPSHSQCRRLQKLAAHRANPRWVGTLTCNLRALTVMGERFVTVRLSELEIDETFEVLSAQMLIEDGSILTGLQIQIQSLSAAAYNWTPAMEEGTASEEPDPLTPDNDIPVPTGLAVAASGSTATLSWDEPPEDFLAVEARFKRTADSAWLAIPVADDATEASIAPLVSGEEYEFQIRHHSPATGRVSDWTASVTVTMPAQDELGAGGGNVLGAGGADVLGAGG